MQFIDLNRQYERIKKDMDARIQAVIDRKSFIMGPEIEELEKKLATKVGRKFCLSCSSGTTALVIPLMAYDLKASDAVFVSSFTFFASAEAINLAGATPVFVDSDETYNMDPAKLEEAIQRVLKEGRLKPRGVIPVDLFGLPADYNRIIPIARSHNMFVLEDAAQGFGGKIKGRMACSFGDVSATSFFPAKPLGCYGDGGAVFTDDEELYVKMRSIRVHGQGSDRYDNIRMGINGRLDTIQAAVLLSKLTVFDDEIEKKNLIAKKYDSYFSGSFITPSIPEGFYSSYAQYTLQGKDTRQRNEIISKMKEAGIPIMVYYPVPMHKQTAYKYLGYKTNDFPVCEKFSNTVFSLPMHAYLTDDELSFIAEGIMKNA